jgi:hypothetical protein
MVTAMLERRMPVPGDPFLRTLRDLESTLTAGHIAVFPVWCWVPPHNEDQLQEKLSPEADDFSYVPARDVDGTIRIVVHRGHVERKGGPIAYTRERLTAEHVIDAGEPLRGTIAALEGRGFLLVQSPESGQPDGIGGIITRADVQKTPVRLLLFANLIEIETRLRRGLTDTKWEVRADCDSDRSDAEKKKMRYRGDTLDALENYLGIGGLLRVARRVGANPLPELNDTEFTRRVRQIKKARDQVCHGLDVRGNHSSPTTAGPSEAFHLIEETREAVSRLGSRRQ